jgi:hypothetical protein
MYVRRPTWIGVPVRKEVLKLRDIGALSAPPPLVLGACRIQGFRHDAESIASVV